jgi:hypothetical protein
MMVVTPTKATAARCWCASGHPDPQIHQPRLRKFLRSLLIRITPQLKMAAPLPVGGRPSSQVEKEPGR